MKEYITYKWIILSECGEYRLPIGAMPQSFTSKRAAVQAVINRGLQEYARLHKWILVQETISSVAHFSDLEREIKTKSNKPLCFKDVDVFDKEKETCKDCYFFQSCMVLVNRELRRV